MRGSSATLLATVALLLGIASGAVAATRGVTMEPMEGVPGTPVHVTVVDSGPHAP